MMPKHTCLASVDAAGEFLAQVAKRLRVLGVISIQPLVNVRQETDKVVQKQTLAGVLGFA